MSNEPVIERLHHLVRVNHEAEAGLNTAAKDVKNSELETMFSGYASQHAGFAAELISEIQRMGGDAASPDAGSGLFQRGWSDLKSALSGHSAGSLLSACEDAEQTAESAYLDATDQIRSGQIHTLLQKQCEKIKAFRTRLHRLVGEIKDGVDFQVNE